MIATATYESDDLRVTFVCQMERADYGVPRRVMANAIERALSVHGLADELTKREKEA